MDFLEKLEIVATGTQKTHFFNSHTFEADIGQHFDKVKKIHQGGATILKQLKYFSYANNSTTLTPPGPLGVS